tara:strand:+ start:6491 stop:7546 length:1056 start_codon:yes stop_codon:yes gene_type:complete
MNEWKKITLRSDENMKKAIQVLNSEALGIVLVSDKEGFLIGTITDSDIRRALISNNDLDSHLQDFMCKNPISSIEGEDRETILEKMKLHKIFQMPILNSQGKIVNIKTLHHLIENKKYGNPIFLMAGGFGTRLQPLTNNIPKPLLKVGSKPIMEIILEQLIEHGFYNFFISTHYKAEMIKSHFGDGSKWGITIKYLYEKEPLGTAGALGLLPKNMPNLPIIMMNADILTKVNFNQLLKYHNKNSAIATMCLREYDFQIPYGVVQIKKSHITSIEEKPIHKFFINAGIYVLNPKIIRSLNGYDYIDMPNLLENQIELNEKVNSFPIHEYWIDIGRINQLDKANQEVASMFNK